jgi:FkbM family methyltransferase
MSLSRISRKFFFRISGNKFSQNLIDKRIKALQRLAGVGTGGSVGHSGEFAILKNLKRLKSPSYCIFDVGANRGDFTGSALPYFSDSESFSIHCFEPSKTAFKALSDKLKGNPHVILNNIGLGKEKGEFDLFTDSPGSGGASLTKRNLEHFGIEFSQSEKIRVDRVDSYCSANDIERIDLLKIDVEGHEHDVLRGAQSMFENEGIRIVTFEFGGCNIDTRTYFRDFYYFFKERHFQLYRITPSGYLYPIPSYKESYEQFRTTNFLAGDRDFTAAMAERSGKWQRKE